MVDTATANAHVSAAMKEIAAEADNRIERIRYIFTVLENQLPCPEPVHDEVEESFDECASCFNEISEEADKAGDFLRDLQSLLADDNVETDISEEVAGIESCLTEINDTCSAGKRSASIYDPSDGDPDTIALIEYNIKDIYDLIRDTKHLLHKIT